MNRKMPIRSGWELSDPRFRDLEPPTIPTMADTGEIDLHSFLRTIYRRKWMLLSIMGASMGVTMLWLLHATPYYEAEVLIVVESRPSSIVKVDESVQDVISDRGKVNTEVAVLELRGLATRVIHDLELDRDPEFIEDAASHGHPGAVDSGGQTSNGGFQPKVVSTAIIGP